MFYRNQGRGGRTGGRQGGRGQGKPTASSSSSFPKADSSPTTFQMTKVYQLTVREHAYIGKKGYTIPKSVLDASDLQFLYKDLYMIPEKQGPSYGPAATTADGEDMSAFPIYRENTKKIYLPRFYGIERYGYPSNVDAEVSSLLVVAPITCTFDKPLRDYQEVVVDSYVSHVQKHPLQPSSGGIITIGCGRGKCLAKDTPILMYDGTIKMVQDVVVGDQLMGDDSGPRNVLTLARGRETMYKIHDVMGGGGGESYTVNESHILTLMYDDDVSPGNLSEPSLVRDISVLDYLASVAVGEQSRWRGFRVPIRFPRVELKCSPYAIGLELGQVGGPKSYVTEGNEGRIPHTYKCNSRINQLKLLAGIIDKCGYFDGCKFVIEHPDSRLKTDIVFLARSLGFKVRTPDEHIEIYGRNLDEIPIKNIDEDYDNIYDDNPRRRDCHPYPASDAYPISVEKLPEDEYYGFEIDGNRRFVLGDFTVTHNTVMAIKIISLLAQKTLIVVHKEFLLNQWVERIQEFMPTARIGRIQGPVFDSAGKDIVIGMLQTLYDRDFPEGCFDDFGLTIVDEVHRIGSCQFSKALLRIQTPHMLGVTATLERKDGLTKVIHHFIGPTVYSDPGGLQSDDGSVLVRGMEFISRDPEFNEVVTDYRGNTQFSTMITKLCGHGPRTHFLVQILAGLVQETPEAQILVLGHNRCLLTDLHDAIVGKEIATVGYYLGGMKQAALETTTEKQIILATYAMASEGFDHKNLSILVMVTPKTDIVQSVGRIFRQKHARPLIVDVVDKHDTFQNQWRKRRAYYKKCGFRIHQATNLAPTDFKVVHEPKISGKCALPSVVSTSYDDDDEETKPTLGCVIQLDSLDSEEG